MPKRRQIKIADLLPNPTVLAIDPGGTTGWAVMSVHAEALCAPRVSILNNIEHWSHGEIGGPEAEQVTQIMGIYEQWPGACLLIEDFILRKMLMSRELLSPVRITAMLSYACFLGGYAYYLQNGGYAMSTATDSRLKEWGLYERAGGMRHARDADRHAITWLRQCKTEAFLRAKCWPYLYGPGGEFGTGIVAR